MKHIIIPLIFLISLIPTGEETIKYTAENNDLYIDATVASPFILEQPIVLATKVADTSYLGLLNRYNNWNATLMYDIMKCESNFNPKAVGDTKTKHHSYGLLQIRNLPSRDYPIEILFNPEENIRIANEIFTNQSYWAWKNCYELVR